VIFTAGMMILEGETHAGYVLDRSKYPRDVDKESFSRRRECDSGERKIKGTDQSHGLVQWPGGDSKASLRTDASTWIVFHVMNDACCENGLRSP
jgi:hypothetical protein